MNITAEEHAQEKCTDRDEKLLNAKLTLCLLAGDNLCKQFGPISGPTEPGPIERAFTNI